MRLACPVDLTEEPEGGFTVTFPDVPEPTTHGRDREEALREAEAAVASAVSFYADEGQAFPRRSPAAARPLVHVFSPAAQLPPPGRARALSGPRSRGADRSAS